MPEDKWKDFRIFLKELLHDPAVRRLIEQRSDISSRTLSRWISGETEEPERKRLVNLVQALPHYRDPLVSMIIKGIPDFDIPLIDHTPNFTDEIPQTFWIRLLEAHANTPRNLHFHALIDLVLLQLQPFVDPEQIGVYLTLACCMPPSRPEGQVRSLREILTRTTYNLTLERLGEHTFMGAETLSGRAVSTGQAHIIQNISNERVLPIRRVEGINSVATYPIQRAGQIAGCLIIASPQPHTFKLRLQYLLQIYSHFLALAFESHQFYPLHRIHLQLMPSRQVQYTYIEKFHSHFLSITRQNPSLSRSEAEMQAWQCIEDELLSKEFTHADPN